jgi:hypothetical protein
MNKIAQFASILLAIVAFPSSADQGKAQARMTFTSLPIAQDLGTTAHKLMPYQHEDRIFVIVVDPIMCGQRPVDARFDIRDGRISLHYDLTAAPAGARQGCTAHSTFDLEDVPHGGSALNSPAARSARNRPK